MTRVHEQALLEKLRHLPPEQMVEVEHFVDFLAQRQTEARRLTQAASQVAEPAFAKIWDNPDDADYDRL
jgi:CHAD domain-containing protein